jgi:AraC-like DNA-binding protein
LAGFVRDYAGYHERLPYPVRRSEFASSRVTVLIGCADPIEIPGHRSGVTSLVAGPRTMPAVTAVRGRQAGVALQLSPLAAYATFGVPMHLLVDQFLSLEDVLGKPGVQLTEQVASAASMPQRFALVAAALTHLRAAGPVPDVVAVNAWRQLGRTGQRTSVALLAEHLGYTRRHLSRMFRQQIGLTPKTASLVRRFERACAMLREGRRSFAAIAAEAGYADQAHLNRDMRAFTGCAPGRFNAQRMPAFTEYLSQDDSPALV